jgi:hypothetical protein
MLRAEDHQVGIGPRPYPSFSGYIQDLGRDLGGHPHGILQRSALKLHGVADSLVHGQRAAGQHAVGKAHGALL